MCQFKNDHPGTRTRPRNRSTSVTGTPTRVPAQLKRGIADQGLNVGPLVFVPLTTPDRRLGALGMSGPASTVYTSEDIRFLRLIGRVVALRISDSFNLRQAEAIRLELERQNDRLQRTERELREVIETIPCMAWSATPDGNAEFFNRRWLDYAGLTADQARGTGWTAALHPNDHNGLVDYWQQILASFRPGEFEARLRRFDGEYRWFLFRHSTPRRKWKSNQMVRHKHRYRGAQTGGAGSEAQRSLSRRSTEADPNGQLCHSRNKPRDPVLVRGNVPTFRLRSATGFTKVRAMGAAHTPGRPRQVQPSEIGPS